MLHVRVAFDSVRSTALLQVRPSLNIRPILEGEFSLPPLVDAEDSRAVPSRAGDVSQVETKHIHPDRGWWFSYLEAMHDA